MYKNLVIKGGGVKGAAYSGAFQALQDKGILQGIEKIAGTSAGAIAATLVAVGYTAEEINTLTMSLDFNKIKDRFDPLRIPISYGLYAGHYILNWIETQVANKLGPKATFKLLKDKDLYLVATDPSLQDVQVFCKDHTPNVIISEAVRASMSIPIFFEAWQFSQGTLDNRIYEDGGVLYNYPIDLFDLQDPNPETIGLYLTHPPVTKYEIIKKWDLEDYILATFEAALSSQEIDFEKALDDKKRSVLIPDGGIKTTDFGITDTQKSWLYNSGLSATSAFLANQK